MLLFLITKVIMTYIIRYYPNMLKLLKIHKTYLYLCILL